MKLPRETLFALVWEKPLYKLAPDFGISDRGLAKVCDRNNIPMPPHGYFWVPSPQNAHGRFNPTVKRSACVPFHDVIVDGLSSSETVKSIHGRIKGMGFPGSISSVTEYAAKLTRGQERIVRSRNRFGSFEYNRARSPKSYEVDRPPLPSGPPVIYIGEREPTVQVAEPVQVDGTVLDAIRPELDYAKERYPELFIALWLEIGTSLAATAYPHLKWEHIQDTGNGWEIVGPLGVNGRSIRAKVADRARNALQAMRKSSGRVLTSPNRERSRLSWILGPDWKRHSMTLRASLVVAN